MDPQLPIPPAQPVEQNQALAQRVIARFPVYAVLALIIIWSIFLLIKWFWVIEDDDFFARLGQVGDVTGGIAGPILNFGGMLIVYYSLREQLRANNDQNLAIMQELKRVAKEATLKSVQQAIGLAEQEWQTVRTGFPQLRDALSEYHRVDNLTRNPDAQPQAWQRIVAMDIRFQELAGLYLLVESKLNSEDFPKDEKLYMLNEFYRRCIQLFGELPFTRIERGHQMSVRPYQLNIETVFDVRNYVLSSRATVREAAMKL